MSSKLPNITEHVSHNKSFYIRMINFIIVSCFGLVINTIVFMITLQTVPDFFPVYPVLLELSLPDELWDFFSVITAIGVTTIWNFVINKIWTFRGHGEEKNVALQTSQYMIVGAIGAVENLAIYAVFTTLIFISPNDQEKIIAEIIGFIVSVLSNFILNNFWTFSDKKDRKELL